MPEWVFLWTESHGDRDTGGIDHVAAHGVTMDEFEHIVKNPTRGPEASRSNPTHEVCWGYTPTGRYLMAVYDVVDETTVMPITAYEQFPWE